MKDSPSTRRLCLPWLTALCLLASGIVGCVEKVTVEAGSSETAPLGVGESREIVLRFLRFDVQDFRQTLTLADLKAMPQQVIDETWLLDMDMKPLIENVLSQVSDLPPAEAYAMPKATRNLWKLLNMTPVNADLSGTSLSSLLGVGNAVGLPASKILADMVGCGINDPIISADVTAEAVLTDIIAPHPNTKFRQGPVDEEHPDGQYPVTPGTMPVGLADVLSNFAGLDVRYGPAGDHPGFIKQASEIMAAGDDFAMTVSVNVNALPYKGVDLNLGAQASVNSTGGQIDELFNVSAPDWLQIQGMPDELSIPSLTMGIVENDALIPSGDSREPLPMGSSPVWATPSWEFEHLLATTGMLRAARIDSHCTTYSPEGSQPSSFEAVRVCIDETGWAEITVDDSVVLSEPPPAPSYFWDILLEVAQARLHDGGLAEGDADIDLTVEGVSVGIPTQELVAQIRSNIEKNPRGLKGVAEQLTDSTLGDADFYYYQAGEGEQAGADYLYFIVPEDLRKDDNGQPVRPYSYVHIGFYKGEDLSEKISSTEVVDGDGIHEKVKIEPGMTIYMEDDEGQLYSVSVGSKPSPHRVRLTLTRLR